jgi:hypothetical protein
MADIAPESRQAPGSPWQVFTRQDFFLLWSSGVAVTVSTLLFTLISSQWLYDTTGSAALLGLLGVVQFVQLPVALYGGMLADRLDRKKLLVLTQLANAALIVTLTILAADHNLKIWSIFRHRHCRHGEYARHRFSPGHVAQSSAPRSSDACGHNTKRIYTTGNSRRPDHILTGL